MKPYAGFQAQINRGNRIEPLPEGAYVAVIKATKIEGTEPDETLIIRLDVSEGPHEGYFLKRYKHDSEKGNGKYEPRYKGDFRLVVPNPNNKRRLYPESDRRKFEDAIARIQASNPGYQWDWNKDSLVGLTVGINMQAGDYNGVPYTSIGQLEIADDVRAGKISPMPRREPRGDAYEPPVTIDDRTGYAQVNTEEVPFD